MRRYDPLPSEASLSLGLDRDRILSDGSGSGDSHAWLRGCLLEVHADLGPVAVLPPLLRDADCDKPVLLLHLERLVG